MSEELPIVLVSGVSGFVGSHVCLAFLKDGGFRVRGTVRDPTNEKKVAPLKKSFGEYFDKLELVKADLNDGEAWKTAMKGVTYVAHVASPVPDPKAKQNEETLVTPAINGCKYVAEAAALNGVKRIVFCSSLAAIQMQVTPPDVYTTDQWSTEECRGITPYDIGKFKSEKFLWDYQKSLPEDKKFELVVINPAAIVGPQLQSADNVFGGAIADMLKGGGMITDHQTGIADVRDVALAHLNGIKFENAAGRRYFLTVADGMPLENFAKVLYDRYGPHGNKEFPKCKNPKDKLPKWPLSCMACCNSQVSYALELWGKNLKFDNTDTREILKIDFRSPEQAIIDCVESLKEWQKVTPFEKK